MAKQKVNAETNDDGQAIAEGRVNSPLELSASTVPFYTSLDLATPRGATLYKRAARRADKQIEKLAGEVIEVRDVLIQSLNSVKPSTGEVEHVFRTVLIAANGDTVSSTSPEVMAAVTALEEIHGTLPWAEPISVKVSKFGSTRGQTTYVIDDVGN